MPLYVFSGMVGMVRPPSAVVLLRRTGCAIPARVVAGGTNTRATLAFEEFPPLHAARTSQRLQVNTYSHPTFNQLSNPFSGFMSLVCLPPGFGFRLLHSSFPARRRLGAGGCLLPFPSPAPGTEATEALQKVTKITKLWTASRPRNRGNGRPPPHSAFLLLPSAFPLSRPPIADCATRFGQL